MKTCSRCLNQKDTAAFGKRSDKPHLFRSHCNECIRIKSNSDYARELQNINRRNRYKNDEEYRNKVCSVSKARWETHKDQMISAHKKWVSKNREKVLAYGRYHRSLRRALERMATPPWADLGKIKEIYANCPKGYHVDHIVPLNGKNICGLHIPANLQYLTASENLKKGNRF